MNDYENGVIKYAIDFERYKNGQANSIISLFDDADIKISKYIKQTKGVYTKARYKEIAKKLHEISRELKETVDENIDIDSVIDYELKKEKVLFSKASKYIQKIKGEGEINFLYPSKEQIKTAALFKPVTENLTYDSYLNGIESGLFNVWDSAVRTGYLTGQTTQQIVRSVLGGVSQIDNLTHAGTIQPLRNSIYGNTRTLLQSFAETTREAVYKENEQYFGEGEYKYEYLATLDARTCLVCGNLDGKLFKSLEDAPHIPQHRNCRCLLIPYFNIDNDIRASKNGYIDSDTSFNGWLEVQNEETQKDVLGITRYNLYKNGVKLDQFVDNGKVLTLNQLYKNLDYDETYGFFEKGKSIPSEVAIITVNPTDDEKNCTACAVAYEAQLRGYNVYAKSYEGNEYIKKLSYDFTLAWLDENGNHPKATVLDTSFGQDIKSALKKTVKENERYVFSFKWLNGDKIHGHIVNVLRKGDDIIFIDSQLKEIYGKELYDYIMFGKYIDKKYAPELLSVKHLKFDENFVENILGEYKK